MAAGRIGPLPDVEVQMLDRTGVVSRIDEEEAMA